MVQRTEEGPINHSDGRRPYSIEPDIEGLESIVPSEEDARKDFMRRLQYPGVEVTDSSLTGEIISLIENSEVDVEGSKVVQEGIERLHSLSERFPTK